MNANFFRILSVCLFVLLAIAPVLSAYTSTFYLSKNYDDNWDLAAIGYAIMALPFSATALIAMIVGLITYQMLPNLSKVFVAISILASTIGLLAVIFIFK
jgi:hypothetical protein